MTSTLLRLENSLSRAHPVVRWIPVALWYGVIFILSHAPGTDAYTTADWLDAFGLRGLNSMLRALAHMGVFGLLAVLIYAAIQGNFRYSGQSFILAILINAALGVSDELHQSLVPLRACKVQEMVTDAVGGVLAVAAILGAFSWLRRRRGTSG